MPDGSLGASVLGARTHDRTVDDRRTRREAHIETTARARTPTPRANANH